MGYRHHVLDSHSMTPLPAFLLRWRVRFRHFIDDNILAHPLPKWVANLAGWGFIVTGVGFAKWDEYTVALILFVGGFVVLILRASYWQTQNKPIKWLLIFLAILGIPAAYMITVAKKGDKPWSDAVFKWTHQSAPSASPVPPTSNENIHFVGGYNVRPPDLTTPKVPDKPTLYWFFTEDFPQYWIPKIDTRIITDGKENKIESAIFLDFPGRSRFVGFYLPGGVNTYAVCKLLPDAVPLLNAHFDLGHEFKANGIFDKSETTLADLSSTGRVYVYYEDTLTLQQEAQLNASFNSRHLGVVLRGDDWLRLNILSNNKKK